MDHPFKDCQWISNESFEGYVKNNLPFKARGHYKYINGDQVYYGEWINGHIHKGIGILTLENSKYRGTVFICGWKNGEKSGYLLNLEANKNNPEIIDSIKCSTIINDTNIFSHEIQKPVSITDFMILYNLVLMNIQKNQEYKAF